MADEIIRVVPRGYLNLGHLLMNHLIVLPKKKVDRDGYIISYLLKAGNRGDGARQKKSIRVGSGEQVREGARRFQANRLDPRCKEITGSVSNQTNVVSARIKSCCDEAEVIH